MTLYEMAFLALACSGFGLFFLFMVLATLQDKSYARAEALRRRGAHN